MMSSDFCVLPLHPQIRANPRLLSVLNMMSGGVFLATALCHLLSESAESFEGHFDDFPMAYLLAGCGFMVTLFIEQIAHYLSDKASRKHHHAHHSVCETPSTSLIAASINDDVSLVVPTTPVITFPADVQKQLSPQALEQLREHYDAYAKSVNPQVSNNHYDNNNNNSDVGSSTSDVEHGHHHHHHHEHHEHHEDHGHSHGIPQNIEGGMIMVIAIWLALCFHSMMEGLALGAAETVNTGIFIAIVAHKGLESFALGTSMIRTNCSMLRYVTMCAAFAAMTPIGILIGMIIEHFAEDSLVSAGVGCIACGTFLYVGIVEVIINEIHRKHDKLAKCLMLILGFGFMAMLALWV